MGHIKCKIVDMFEKTIFNIKITDFLCGARQLGNKPKQQMNFAKIYFDVDHIVL